MASVLELRSTDVALGSKLHLSLNCHRSGNRRARTGNQPISVDHFEPKMHRWADQSSTIGCKPGC